jgi:putative ABC transport system substrate-binding protein
MSLRRREFIAGLGSAAAWPLAARAQQPALPVIGVLGSGSRSASDFLLTAFAQGLRQQGFVEDRTSTSTTAGRRVITISCPRWRLNLFAAT